MSEFRPGGQFKLIPDVVKNLMIINGLFFLATFAFQGMGVDLVQSLGLHYWGSDKFAPYQFVTHLFMHGSFLHIFSNMFMLWMFGSQLENFWGPSRFLFFYLFTGLGAAALHSVVMGIEMSALESAAQEFMNNPTPEQFKAFVDNHGGGYFSQKIYDFIHAWQSSPDDGNYVSRAKNEVQNLVQRKEDIPTVGASGAVFGVLLAFGMLFPNSVILIPILFFMPVKVKYFVIFYGLFELYAGFQSFSGGSNIAHFAHLGGMLFAFILIKYWNRNSKNFF